MKITEARVTDSGMYLCVATNIAGNFSQAVRLSVLGKACSWCPGYLGSHQQTEWFIAFTVCCASACKVHRTITPRTDLTVFIFGEGGGASK